MLLASHFIWWMCKPWKCRCVMFVKGLNTVDNVFPSAYMKTGVLLGLKAVEVKDGLLTNRDLYSIYFSPLVSPRNHISTLSL